jgi:hypothetical protein
MTLNPDEIKKSNQSKFAAIRALNLPLKQYAIISSGALGIRNLRTIGDIDILVTDELWNALAKQYGIIEEKGLKKIVFPDGIVEALGTCSFPNEKEDLNIPSISQRIAYADIIDGLPFELLEHVLYFKCKMGREKDLQDIKLIEAYLKE